MEIGPGAQEEHLAVTLVDRGDREVGAFEGLLGGVTTVDDAVEDVKQVAVAVISPVGRDVSLAGARNDPQRGGIQVVVHVGPLLIGLFHHVGAPERVVDARYELLGAIGILGQRLGVLLIRLFLQAARREQDCGEQCYG